MKKRIFTSIDVPTHLKQRLRAIQQKNIYWIKWMAPENFHITLNFLGDLDSDEIETAKSVIATLAAAYEPFELEFQKFRGEREMLWLLPSRNEILEKLQWELRTELKKAGVGKTERHGFTPHILVAKSKTGRRMSWEPKNFEPLKFIVDRINIYESELTPGAATHTLIQSIALANPKNQAPNTK